MLKPDDTSIKPVFIGKATIGFSPENKSIQVKDDKGTTMDLPLKDFHPKTFKRLHQFLAVFERGAPL